MRTVLIAVLFALNLAGAATVRDFGITEASFMGAGGCPPVAVSTVATNSPVINAFLWVEALAREDVFGVEWLDPNGNLVDSFTYPATIGGFFSSSWCSFFTLVSPNYFPESPRNVAPGTWTARAKVNGSVLRTLEFEVTPVYCGQYILSTLEALVSARGGTGILNLRSEFGCAWTAVPDASWISVQKDTRGVKQGNSVLWSIAYTVAPNNSLAPRQAAISVANQDFLVKQAAGPPDLTITSVLPATGVPGNIAAGSLMTVLGSGFCSPEQNGAATEPWPETLQNADGNVRLLVDGQPLPLHYAGPGGAGCQINAQLPWNMSEGTHTAQVEFADLVETRLSKVFFFGSALVNPSFFSAPPEYPTLLQIADRGYALMTETNPIYPGETAVLYANGFGPTSPPLTTGSSPQLPPGVLANVNATVDAWVKECLGADCNYLPAALVYAVAFPASPAAYQVAFTLPPMTVEASRQYSLVVRVGGQFAPDLVLNVAPRPAGS